MALVSFQTVWMFHFWVESIICLLDNFDIFEKHTDIYFFS